MAQPIPNFDASFCGRLPLHQTNLVQPHGLLFVLHPATLQVLQVSENISAALPGVAAPDVVNKPLSFFLTLECFGTLQETVAAGLPDRQFLNLTLAHGGTELVCSAALHQKGDAVLLELVLPAYAPAGGRSFLAAFKEIKTLMQKAGNRPDVGQFAAAVAKEVKRISGFDKVMVYAFDTEWHGDVIAEEKEAGMDAYMGLRFPASDVPKPARDLYLKNPYRIIPDAGAKPVRLYPLLHPATNGFTDLSGADLRSVAGVHLEYLKNMDVAASLSFRLVHNGALWGLLSCHHRTPRYFSFEALGLFELLSDVISAQLSIVLNEGEQQKQQTVQNKLTDLAPRLNGASDPQEAITENSAAIQALLGATGLAYNLSGRMEWVGQVPGPDDLSRLFYWMEAKAPEGLVHQPALPQVFEDAALFAPVASGLLALPVVPGKGNFLLAFRPEAVTEVAWGGNPHEALQIEPDGRTYHPRNSFNIWRQTVRHTARPWNDAELAAAEALKNVLAGLMLSRLHA